MLRLALAFGLAGVLVGASASFASQNGDAGTDKHGTSAKDPVATAFALPHGTKLRKDQQTEFDSLKKTYTPKLQEAIDGAHSGDEKDKTAKAKEAQKIRQEIKTKITEILNKPDPTVKQAAPKAPKQQQPRRHR